MIKVSGWLADFKKAFVPAVCVDTLDVLMMLPAEVCEIPANSCQIRPLNSAIFTLPAYPWLPFVRVRIQIRSNKTYNTNFCQHMRCDMIELFVVWGFLFIYGSLISLSGSSGCFAASLKDVPHMWNLITASRNTRWASYVHLHCCCYIEVYPSIHPSIHPFFYYTCATSTQVQ